MWLSALGMVSMVAAGWCPIKTGTRPISGFLVHGHGVFRKALLVPSQKSYVANQ